MDELNSNSKIGEMVFWKTLCGERFNGKLIEWDSNVAVVLCDDGKTRSVEC